MDEMLDIVDKQDRVIGQKWRSEVYANKMSNFRVVNAFIVNDENKLWIPRRSAHKKLFPLFLDASIGGHVIASETYDQAFKRELQEEVGIDASVVQYKCVGVLNPDTHGTSAFMHVYTLRANEVPNYNKEDFIEYFWLSPQEVLDRLSTNDFGKSDLPKMIKYLFFS